MRGSSPRMTVESSGQFEWNPLSCVLNYSMLKKFLFRLHCIRRLEFHDSEPSCLETERFRPTALRNHRLRSRQIRRVQQWTFRPGGQHDCSPSAWDVLRPIYPTLVLAAMKLDARFAAAVQCSVEADRGHRDEANCEAYAVPMRLINACLLVIGLIAIACAAELIVRRNSTFLVAGSLVLAGLAAEADIFSYVMTESAIFAIYSICVAVCCSPGKRAETRYFLFGGGLLGLLCLTKPSFLILFPADSGTEPALRIPVVERAAATYGRRVLGFQYGVCDVVSPFGPGATQSPSANSD